MDPGCGFGAGLQQDEAAFREHEIDVEVLP
jgi:hypothetical protein